MRDNIIVASNVGVYFKQYKSRRRTFREAVFRTLARSDEVNYFWALRYLSFEVKEGESLGIIGSNGSGKSTLCLMLSKILAPEEGTLQVSGEVSALLTLGAGFQGDLSGRDNIFINGILLGLHEKEVREKMGEIIEFSELGDFIDAPVRTYSSGMKSRLGFSIASTLNPDILILDEVLGVGDQSFKVKSSNRLMDMIEQSRAVIVVSHNMNTIRRLCTRTIWLDRGKLMADGPTKDVVRQYCYSTSGPLEYKRPGN